MRNLGTHFSGCRVLTPSMFELQEQVCLKLVSSYERVQGCDTWRSKCCCWLKSFDQVGLWPPWNLGRFSKVNLEPTTSPQATLVFPCVRNHPKLLSQDTSVLIICTAYVFCGLFFQKKDWIPSKKKISLNHHWCHGLANATTSITMAWTFDTSCGLCKAGRCCNLCCGSQIEICTFFAFALRIKSWGCSFKWLSIVSNACLCLPNHLVPVIFSCKGVRSKKWPNTYWLCCWLVNFQYFVSTEIDTIIE